MKPKLYVPLVLIAIAAAGCDSAVDAPPRQSIVKGTIPLAEVSGATFVGDSLLIAADDLDKSDDTKKFRMVALIPEATKRLESPPFEIRDEHHLYDAIASTFVKLPAGTEATKEAEEKLHKEKEDFATDFEDVVPGEEGQYYLISSHSLSSWKRDESGKVSGGKRSAKRTKFISLAFASGSVAKDKVSDINLGLIDKLPSSIDGTKSLTPGEMKDGIYTPGFNIEGAALSTDGDLLLGLRSPVNEKQEALVLRYKKDQWEKGVVAEPEVVALALNPKLSDDAKQKGLARGIRGIARDDHDSAKGYWIIAGLAADHNGDFYGGEAPKNEWSLWFWDGDKKLVEFTPAELGLSADMPNPEAICVVPKANGKPHRLLLISDDDAARKGEKGASRYALFPAPDLNQKKAEKPTEPEASPTPKGDGG
ncbi:MAG: hypothetical protein ACO1SV_14445 [Fimbriimonas sp.]